MKEINYGRNMTMKDAPVLRKTGVVSGNGEFTPFVWKGRLYRMEIKVLEEPVDGHRTCTLIIDVMARKECARVAYGQVYTSGYCEDDIIYIFCMKKRKNPGEEDQLMMYKSADMVNWEEHPLFTRPGWRLFNTSVCKGPDGYRMAIEVSADQTEDDALKHKIDPIVGIPYTEFFLKSDDLFNWEWLPDDHCYTPERYCACPVLRYSEGYYYMICLEALPLVRYAPYIYRTKDFFTWEVGYHNPVMIMSNEDRKVQEGIELDEKEYQRVTTCFNINNSDVDLCEFEGKTYFYYGVGDQLSRGQICEAIYDGPMSEYFRRMFE